MLSPPPIPHTKHGCLVGREKEGALALKYSGPINPPLGNEMLETLLPFSSSGKQWYLKWLWIL